jgi:hypothetical protein
VSARLALDIWPPLALGAHADVCSGVLVSYTVQRSAHWRLVVLTCPVCGYVSGEHAVALIDQARGQAVPLDARQPLTRRIRGRAATARTEKP